MRCLRTKGTNLGGSVSQSGRDSVRCSTTAPAQPPSTPNQPGTDGAMEGWRERERGRRRETSQAVGEARA
eukprot:3602913-Rhodomonas_salina.1